MGTTPNRAFPWPDANGRIRDGWAAIRALADAVDTWSEQLYASIQNVYDGAVGVAHLRASRMTMNALDVQGDALVRGQTRTNSVLAAVEGRDTYVGAAEMALSATGGPTYHHPNGVTLYCRHGSGGTYRLVIRRPDGTETEL